MGSRIVPSSAVVTGLFAALVAAALGQRHQRAAEYICGYAHKCGAPWGLHCEKYWVCWAFAFLFASPPRKCGSIRSQFSSQRHLMLASAFIGYRISISDAGSTQNGQEAGEYSGNVLPLCGQLEVKMRRFVSLVL